MIPLFQITKSIFDDCLDSHLLEASEIISLAVSNFSNAHIDKSTPINKIRSHFQHYLFQIILKQINMRSIHVEYQCVNKMVQSLTLNYDLSTKCININIPDRWVKKLDSMLLTRKCSRCDTTILGESHNRDECDGNLTRNVMEN